MEIVGTILPLALVVGLSPLPILPMVLIVMTPRARPNSLAFLGAWLVALTAVVVGALLLAGVRDPAPPDDKGIGWIQVVTGVAFLALATVKWLRRPAPGEAKEPPAWMSALDSYTPRKAAGLGAALAAANPKNLVMALAAGAEIAALTTSTTAAAAGAGLFVLVGSIGVATPVIAHRLLGDRAPQVLGGWKSWLEANSTALGVGVLVVLGVMVLVKGLSAAL
jgi:threonine/homoserine/homoserine lactone efflux protein